MKRTAIVFLIAQVFFLLLQILKYYLTDYQLVSPLIPKWVAKEIQFPFVIIAISIVPFLLVSTILFYKKLYRACIVLGCIVVVWSIIGQDIIDKFQEHRQLDPAPLGATAL